MKAEQIKEQLEKVFQETFRDTSLQISEATTADDISAWDSLSNMNLILKVEKAFQIRLTTREVRKLADVGDLIKLIQGKTE